MFFFIFFNKINYYPINRKKRKNIYILQILIDGINNDIQESNIDEANTLQKTNAKI